MNTPLQQRLFGSPGGETINVDDRCVLTHHGEVLFQGTHQQCMNKLSSELSCWTVESEEDFAAARKQPYVRHTLVSWTTPEEAKNFLWTRKVVFKDDVTPDTKSGLSLMDFIAELSQSAARIFVNKLPIYTNGKWFGIWQEKMRVHNAGKPVTALKEAA